MMSDLATTLEREGPAISARVIADMYAEPFWLERYGDAGRRPASEDGDFHVRYLVSALRAKSPSTMVEYGRWLRTLLNRRGMCSLHLADNFARLSRALGAGLGEAAGPAIEYLRAAEQGLAYGDGPARAVEAAAAGIAQRAVAGEADEARRERLREDARYVLSYVADGLAEGGEATLAGYLRILAKVHARRGEPGDARDRLLDAIDRELAAEGDAAARELLAAARRAAEAR